MSRESPAFRLRPGAYRRRTCPGTCRRCRAGTPRTAAAAQQGARPAKPSTANGEWPHYAADTRGSRYSPLDQINASNFNQLQVAWRLKTDMFGPYPEWKLEGTPLMIKGVLYTTAGTRRSVIAIDAKSGEVIWTHSLREGQRAAVSPRQLSGTASPIGRTDAAMTASSM